MITGNEGVNGGAIKEFRIARKLSQKELAEKSVTSQVQISRIEIGVEKPSVAMLLRIAKVLEVDVAQLCRM